MISLGMIGLGAVVRNIHLPAYSQLSGRVRVVAGCDPDPAARAYAREKGRLPAIFEDPREMLEKTRPDVVAVCTPPRFHRDHVLLALEHGCHVFCEKPLAEDLAQADDMIQAADGAARLVVINNQFPYMDIHLAAKKRLGSPEFGRLLYLHAWHTMRPTHATEAGWRGELSRRLCFEFGVHVFELVRFFLEMNPVRLVAHMPNPGGAGKGDLINAIALEFADGRGASMVCDGLSGGAGAVSGYAAGRRILCHSHVHRWTPPVRHRRSPCGSGVRSWTSHLSRVDARCWSTVFVRN